MEIKVGSHRGRHASQAIAKPIERVSYRRELSTYVTVWYMRELTGCDVNANWTRTSLIIDNIRPYDGRMLSISAIMVL